MVSYIYSKTMEVLRSSFGRLFGITLFFSLISGLAGIMGVLPIITFPVAYVLSATLAMLMLKKYRTGEDPYCKDTFTFFKRETWGDFLRIAGGTAWSELWILIWGLIPIAGLVFAVIRSYEYAFVPYLLTDRPELKATETRDVSRQLTNGYKGKMFMCDFIIIIGYLVISLLLSLLAARVRFFLIIYVLFGLAFGLIAPVFMNVMHAALYEEITTMTEEKYLSIVQKPARPQYQQQPQQYQAQQPQQYQQQPTKVCPNCGAAVDVNAQFCPNCGTKC